MTKKQTKFLTCRDHTVSKEYFDLIFDKDLEMLITSPKPKESELAGYYESEDYISHTDSSKSLFDRVYQFVKNYTIKKKVDLINSFSVENRSVLDIGCGTGDFLAACKKNGWSVSGVEPNEKARELAVNKIGQLNGDSKKVHLEEQMDNLQKEFSETKEFDVITMWHVLEHVPDLKDYILKLKDLLKPNGVLIIAVPNFKSHDAVHYGKFWAAYDVPRHLWHFSQSAIGSLFLRVNLKVIKTLPMKFDAYYVSLLSEKNRSNSTNAIKAFYRGLVSNFKARKTKEYSSLIYILKNSE